MSETKSPVALVAGASGGIGSAIARELAARGWCLALLAREQSRLDALAEALAAKGGAAQVFSCDITNEGAVDEAVKAVEQRFGRIDLLVNAAGLARAELLVRGSRRTWAELLETNLVAAAGLSKAVVPVLRRAGGGLIVHVGSAAGLDGQKGFAAYAASKAALRSMCATLRSEVARHGIRVSVISPARVDTELQRGVDGRERMIRPEDVARAVGFLLDLSPQATVSEIVIGEAAREAAEG